MNRQTTAARSRKSRRPTRRSLSEKPCVISIFSVALEKRLAWQKNYYLRNREAILARKRERDSREKANA
jgi:hypothetical protein